MRDCTNRAIAFPSLPRTYPMPEKSLPLIDDYRAIAFPREISKSAPIFGKPKRGFTNKSIFEAETFVCKSFQRFYSQKRFAKTLKCSPVLDLRLLY